MKKISLLTLLLSIIIPVFNGEQYLWECLNSLFQQDISVSDYEIICVNDGSTDNSCRILYEFSKQYQNLKLINKENGGVARARNEGLLYAKGDYVWFLDADDFIGFNTLRAIKTILITNKYDRVKLKSYYFVSELSDYEKKYFASGTLRSNYPHKKTQVTRTIFRRKYLMNNEISFSNNLSYGEDTIFYFKTLLYKHKDYLLDKLVYFYRVHEAASTNFNSIDKLVRYIESCCCAINIVDGYYSNKKYRNKSRKALIYWFNTIFWLYSNYKDLRKVNCICKISVNGNLYNNKLKRKYSILIKACESKDFSEVEKEYKKIEKKKKRHLTKRRLIKNLIGYMQHPKRILKLFGKNK